MVVEFHVGLDAAIPIANRKQSRLLVLITAMCSLNSEWGAVQVANSVIVDAESVRESDEVAIQE